MEVIDAVWKSLQARLIKPVDNKLWRSLRDRLIASNAASRQTEELRVQADARAAAPIIWLLGKTGAGKTSIIHALTGADRARIGNGFAPCTRTAAMFDFPEEAPLVRFLDTRGLGEPGYDPAEDIAISASKAHLVLIAMRVMDPDQGAIAAAVRRVRQHHPAWPVLVAQTTLHAAYAPNANHILPYPFDDMDAAISSNLNSALTYQRNLFAGLPGHGPLRFVALDFTPPEDGFTPGDYGRAALQEAITDIAPDALATMIDAIRSSENDALAVAGRTLVLGYAVAAIAPAAVPIPFAGTAGNVVIAAVMLRSLARRYDVEWTARTFSEFTASLGTGVLVSQLARYGGNEVARFIPFAGLALSAAAAFAFTYALGCTACVYLGHRRRGSAAPEAAVRDAFAEAMRQGLRDAAHFRRGPPQPDAAA